MSSSGRRRVHAPAPAPASAPVPAVAPISAPTAAFSGLAIAGPVDYSLQWKQVLENSSIHTFKYLASLSKVLLKCDLVAPPNRPPKAPPAQGEDDVSEVTMTTALRSMTISNRSGPGSQHGDNSSVASSHDSRSKNTFSTLQNDNDSDEDDDESEHDSHLDGLSRHPAPAPVAPRDSMQTRYFLVKLLCAIVDWFRKEAEDNLRQKNILLTGRSWQQAFDIMTQIHTITDAWYAVLDDHEQNHNANDVLMDNHRLQHLNEIVMSVQILSDDTERHKIKHLGILQSRLNVVNEKLNPMLRDRDEVKTQWGDERWESNPRPKQDYAAKRRGWEDEKRKLEECISILTVISFVHRR